jgi:hypothetical protein
MRIFYLLRTCLFLPWLLCSTAAWAVPAQFTHQGRLLDVDGIPLEGDVNITFRLESDEVAGETLWEESLTVPLNNGFYAAILGSDEEENPLDTEVFSQSPLWLEIQIEEEAPMEPRHPVNSVPFATIAGAAEEVIGGPVDASVIAINGSLVIDEDGLWVGETPPVSWSDISDVPDDLADGTDEDTDTFADLGWSCLDGGVATWNGLLEEWTCEVETITPTTWDEIEGIPEGFTDGIDNDEDSLADISCSDGAVLIYTPGGGWDCGTDTDTTLSSDEVRTLIESLSALSLTEGATIGGRTPRFNDETISWSEVTDTPGGIDDGDDDSLAALDCIEGQLAIKQGDGWACTDLESAFDADGDGTMTWADCDETDATIFPGATEIWYDGIDSDCGYDSDYDADGDGYDHQDYGGDDCDDADPASTSTGIDGDCDGTLTADDCDDSDPDSHTTAFDGDCDGTPTADDCDDSDPDTSLVGTGPGCPADSCAGIAIDGLLSDDGLYWVDPGGPGGLEPYEVYCDLTTDGGGWALVAVISGSSGSHVNRNAVGTIGYPDDLSMAKLSDGQINNLSSWDGSSGDSVYRMTCREETDFILYQNGWNSTARNGDTDFTYHNVCDDYSCVTSDSWSHYTGGTSSGDSGGGSYPQFNALQYRADDQNGCFNAGYHRDGLLWVR